MLKDKDIWSQISDDKLCNNVEGLGGRWQLRLMASEEGRKTSRN